MTKINELYQKWLADFRFVHSATTSEDPIEAIADKLHRQGMEIVELVPVTKTDVLQQAHVAFCHGPGDGEAPQAFVKNVKQQLGLQEA